MIQGLRTVIYFVDNMDAAKAWYTKVLGKPPYFDEPFYVGFNVGGYELGLHPAKESDWTKKRGGMAYWGVADARGSMARLKELGGEAVEEVTDVGGEILVGSVKDPMGNFFGIIQNPHFKAE